MVHHIVATLTVISNNSLKLHRKCHIRVHIRAVRSGSSDSVNLHKSPLRVFDEDSCINSRIKHRQVQLCVRVRPRTKGEEAILGVIRVEVEIHRA